MILTGHRIAEEIQAGRIQFDPFNPKHCNPNSVNFHLDRKLLRYKRPSQRWYSRLYRWLTGQQEWALSLRERNEVEEITIPDEGIVLQPGELYLGSTLEMIGSTHYAPLMAARSSMGRLGLFIFLNSGLGDIGFRGQWTLELMTIYPIRLHAGDRIGQMMFFKPEGKVIQYEGKYQDSIGPVSSLIYRDRPSSQVQVDLNECPVDDCSVCPIEDSILPLLQERFHGHVVAFRRSGSDVQIEFDHVLYDVRGVDHGIQYFKSRGTLEQVLSDIEQEIRCEYRRRMAEDTCGS